MSQTTPQVADTELVVDSPDAPRVRVLLTAVAGADLSAALAVVGRQVYEPAPEVVVVGAETESVSSAASLEEAIAGTDSSVDYLWLLHSDARPRPDALAAMVSEIERNEASLAGSKLLKAGTMDELESVGGATDVFGEPYSGLDEGEIDLQQYDVVREVAFVQSASMLVRRDLAQGLKGLDPLLPPVAAGLDFSQRARLAGGRVISVPSSEVYHQARCGARGEGRWEQAGRLRAMLTAYSPLTLLWVIPYDILVSLLDSLANLALLRWRPAVRHGYAWLWNLYHLPSTIRQRRRLHAVRAEGDEELFRFQANGSVRLRVIGEELSGKLLSIFDDDQALARRTRRVWGSPGIWGAIIAAILVLLSARSIVFTGMPNVGYSFPFEPPTVALQRWFQGWNEAGLGAGSAVHPAVGATGLFSLLWFGAEGAARTVLTVGLSVIGVAGMGRLGGRIGIRGPGRYLAGIVLIAGPGTALLVGRGSWLALAGAAILPWAVRAALVRPGYSRGERFGLAGWALLLGVLVAMFSPALAVVPVLAVLLYRALGGDRGSILLGVVALIGGLAGFAFVAGDPGWIADPSRRLDLEAELLWPALVAVAAVPAVAFGGRSRELGLAGGVLSLGTLLVATTVAVGPGIQEALLITSSLGAAMAVAAALDRVSRNVFHIVAAIGGLALVVASVIAVGNGRLGLPAGDVNARLSFAQTLSDQPDPGRILFASVDRELIPGEVRSGPGFWYSVLDGSGTTLDEVWLPEPRTGDDELSEALDEIASGTDLRPGERLAGFAISWVVIEGPTFFLDEVLVPQLDLPPVPLDPDSRVYENDKAVAIAGTRDQPWVSDGVGYAGEAVDGPVPLAFNFDAGWSPDVSQSGWSMTVDGSSGMANHPAAGLDLTMNIAVAVLVIAGLGGIVYARRGR
ncbi:MAG TPA: glycosyltransferase [Acidimicrobiia bacterium]|nr:glycosyltransferase [Acidimicrobiia bacterium]